MKDQEQREQFHWRSAISYKTIDRIVVRGYNINELTGSLDLGEMVYLTWMGELPTKAQGVSFHIRTRFFPLHSGHTFCGFW
jgi:citrate synthase